MRHGESFLGIRRGLSHALVANRLSSARRGCDTSESTCVCLREMRPGTVARSLIRYRPSQLCQKQHPPESEVGEPEEAIPQVPSDGRERHAVVFRSALGRGQQPVPMARTARLSLWRHPAGSPRASASVGARRECLPPAIPCVHYYWILGLRRFPTVGRLL